MKKIINFTLLICLLTSVFIMSVSARDEFADKNKNIALDAKYEVSSENNNADNYGDAALNGEVSQTTRWGNWYHEEDGAGPGGSGNTWFLIDFRSPKIFDRMTFVESANPSLYDNGKCEEWKIEVADSKSGPWTQVATGNWLTKGPNTFYSDISPNLGDPYDVKFAPVEAQYVRLTITKVRREAEAVDVNPDGLSPNLSLSIIAVFNDSGLTSLADAAPAATPEPEIPAAVVEEPVASLVAPTTTPTPTPPNTGDPITLIFIGSMFSAVAGTVIVKKRK